MELNPIRYEMFVHRLMNIAEEGRIALQRVCASPIVVQGGECMASFYEADGTTVLSASGHLRFSAGCADAVKKVIEYYSENPGIADGDQFFMNDPYIASTHVYDQMVIKPIFADGELIAWTASMTHTADTGGILRGGATEIFHEGICSCGIKLMEKDKLRLDVFYTLTRQCRDPDYVGLDLKSRIASNNVCARGFLQLVEKYGVDFVRAACKKLNEDSERMARARLAALPDGIWRSKVYTTATNIHTGEPKVMRIVCAMKKTGDAVEFDYEGTSEQNEDATNSSLVASWGQLYIALTSQLFWNIPWNGGMVKPVTLKIPEGTVLNCRYPAATGGASGIGGFLTAAASACIAKMLYAAGLEEDVNSSWYGGGSGSGGFNTGGPGFMYGGKNQHGYPVGQGIYDMHGAGFGAAPYRDGVASGGHMNNPTVGISDIENIEMQYPLMYLSRNHMVDSRRLRKISRRPWPAAYHPGARLQEPDDQLQPLSRHPWRMGSVRRLSGRHRRRQDAHRPERPGGEVRAITLSGRFHLGSRVGRGECARPSTAEANAAARRLYRHRSGDGGQRLRRSDRSRSQTGAAGPVRPRRVGEVRAQGLRRGADAGR